MKVGVDARTLSGPRGVGRYARDLLGALMDRFPHDEYHALVHRGDAAVVPSGVVVHRSPLPRRLAAASGALCGRPALDRALGGDVDVLWLAAPVPVGVSPGVPLLLTVHDLSFQERPRDFTAYERLWHRVMRADRLLARADHVLVDTEATATAVRRRHALADARVTVVRPGVAVAPAGPRAHRAPYLLWVGALEPRKAPDVLARAYASARADGLVADLVVVGEGRSALAGPGVHALGRVDDETLSALYRDALALVMPSRLEGFGFPPLEAALHGTPSVVTDLPVFRETLGDAAVFVPVDDEEALAAALGRAARDTTLRPTVGRAARDAAERLTWAAAADATHAALVKTADRGRHP